MRKNVIITVAIFLFFSLTGQACTLFGNPAAEQATRRQITLNYWRVFDTEDTMSDIINAYRSIHPNVTINYKTFRFDEYEKELLDALAEDRGPDIFSIPSTWVTEYQNKIEPMPETLQVGFLVTKGTIRKVETAELRSIAGYTPKYMYDNFVTTVGDDVLRTIEDKQRVMGLPLSVDTLALFYNRDILNNAGIAEPPKSWDESSPDLADGFSDYVERLTVLSDPNESCKAENIAQFGAALGGSRNVERSTDILAALMMQSGAEMSRDGRVTLQETPSILQQGTQQRHPAAEALGFYTNFASSGTSYCTWDNRIAPENNSLEVFKQGRAGFFLGYSYHAALLRDAAPSLRFGVTPLPQISQTRRFTTANYWVESVSKKTKEKDYAWDFLMFATSSPQVQSYLSKTEKPTALRSLIADQLKNDNVAPFSQQLLYAISWYRGKSPKVQEKAFLDMIDQAFDVKGGPQEVSDLNSVVNRSVQIIQSSY